MRSSPTTQCSATRPSFSAWVPAACTGGASRGPNPSERAASPSVRRLRNAVTARA